MITVLLAVVLRAGLCLKRMPVAQAMDETIRYVNRARAFIPPGTVPRFITRFGTGGLAVGQLMFSSATHSQGELQDLAIDRVRPLFATTASAMTVGIMPMAIEGGAPAIELWREPLTRSGKEQSSSNEQNPFWRSAAPFSIGFKVCLWFNSTNWSVPSTQLLHFRCTT